MSPQAVLGPGRQEQSVEALNRLLESGGLKLIPGMSTVRLNIGAMTTLTGR
jgi:hypothetical protein